MVDKNSIFGGMITTQGAAKKTNCDALGIPWEPRYMLIGDANGTDPVPSPSQTKLVNQVYRAQINQLRVSPTDANVLIAEVVLPPDVGGWWVRELALEDKDGVFSAVANAPPSYKPVLAQGSGRNQVVRMHIITNGTSNIQLKIDPSVVLATRQYVDESVNGLLPANKPAGTYTKVTVNDRGVFVSGSNPTTLAGYGITDTYTKDQITAMIAQASALPVGSMIGFPVDKVAPGFLELDGSVKSASAYPDLATFLAGAFNKGDEGAGNFRLPESRGEFLRGWDHGRGVDTGRAIGSMQLDSLQGFRMESMRSKASTSWGNDDGGAGDPAYGPPMGSVTPSTRPRNLTGAFVSDGVNGVPRIGSETRPRSLAVMWCIKAWNAPINQGNIDIAALVPLAAQATEINQGTAKVATQIQTDAGADDTTIVTPKKMRFGFQFIKGVNGAIVFPTWLGGFIFQWGQASDVGRAGSGLGPTRDVTLPVAFPTAALSVWATYAFDNMTSTSAYSPGSSIISKSVIRVQNNYTSSAGEIRWYAIGY
ncbi:phage tail protein [Pseudomonas lurida]|uniref:phage tail protein n=1 Tax=Pseudomonas lurida TaxID=244566 RepID=UPI0017835C66|nr:phage tail protein [Pseudomonas lurida]MBD8666545.1 phage tail protein [Pseudomonas lurida]UZQ74622.1 phage tail protein [Pseudomonas lurida]